MTGSFCLNVTNSDPPPVRFLNLNLWPSQTSEEHFPAKQRELFLLAVLFLSTLQVLDRTSLCVFLCVFMCVCVRSSSPADSVWVKHGSCAYCLLCHTDTHYRTYSPCTVNARLSCVNRSPAPPQRCVMLGRLGDASRSSFSTDGVKRVPARVPLGFWLNESAALECKLEVIRWTFS